MPGPLSRMRTRSVAASASSEISIRPVAGAAPPGPATASMAFTSRLVNTCCSSPSQPIDEQVLIRRILGELPDDLDPPLLQPVGQQLDALA